MWQGSLIIQYKTRPLSSVHCLNGNTCQSKSILETCPFSLPEEATSGLQICSRLYWAYSALLSLVPDGGECHCQYPDQGQLHAAVQVEVQSQQLPGSDVWHIAAKQSYQSILDSIVSFTIEKSVLKSLWDSFCVVITQLTFWCRVWKDSRHSFFTGQYAPNHFQQKG